MKVALYLVLSLHLAPLSIILAGEVVEVTEPAPLVLDETLPIDYHSGGFTYDLVTQGPYLGLGLTF